MKDGQHVETNFSKVHDIRHFEIGLDVGKDYKYNRNSANTKINAKNRSQNDFTKMKNM